MKLSKHGLGQLRHIDLLALAVEAGAAASDEMRLHLASQSREQIIDALTRKGPLARLAERAELRLEY